MQDGAIECLCGLAPGLFPDDVTRFGEHDTECPNKDNGHKEHHSKAETCR